MFIENAARIFAQTDNSFPLKTTGQDFYTQVNV